MKFGTVVYDKEIYNLDYMTSEEIKLLLNKVEIKKYNRLRRLLNKISKVEK